MSRPVKRFNVTDDRDTSPYAYVDARWEHGQWDRLMVTKPYPVDPVADALRAVAPAVSASLALIGVGTMTINVCPFRAAPTYWLNMGGFSPTVLGCRPCGADVIRCDMLGMRAADWTAAMEGRLTPVATLVHAALAEVFAPWRPT